MNKKLEGMIFVVTGALVGFTRNSVKEFIEEHGGKMSDSVSKNTTYLVLGEAPGSKLQKAQELSVKIIGIEELKKMCEK